MAVDRPPPQASYSTRGVKNIWLLIPRACSHQGLTPATPSHTYMKVDSARDSEPLSQYSMMMCHSKLGRPSSSLVPAGRCALSSCFSTAASSGSISPPWEAMTCGRTNVGWRREKVGKLVWAAGKGQGRAAQGAEERAIQDPGVPVSCASKLPLGPQTLDQSTSLRLPGKQQ